MLINNKIVYKSNYKDFGEISIQSFNLNEDSKTLHDWVNREYAVFWGMQNTSFQEVKKQYQRLIEPEHYKVFVGVYNNEKAFFVECYEPIKDIIKDHYNAKPSDCGIHIIMAPPSKTKIPNFTFYMFQSVVDFVFSNQKIDRIIVEPDIRNLKMFNLCKRIGFKLSKTIQLPNKTAILAFLEKNKHK